MCCKLLVPEWGKVGCQRSRRSLPPLTMVCLWQSHDKHSHQRSPSRSSNRQAALSPKKLVTSWNARVNSSSALAVGPSPGCGDPMKMETRGPHSSRRMGTPLGKWGPLLSDFRECPINPHLDLSVGGSVTVNVCLI